MKRTARVIAPRFSRVWAGGALLLLALGGCSKPHPEAVALPPAGESVGAVPAGRVKVGRPYTVNGATYHPVASARGYRAEGIGSWYGPKFHGRTTANGERFDMYAMTAAHTTLPMPTRVRVTNLENNRQVVVRVNDRGPFVKNRLIDLSYAAAKALGYHQQGTARVRVESLEEEGTAAATAEQALFVQVGSFQDYGNAQRLVQRLAPLGQAHIQSVSLQGTAHYRVRVGPLAGRADARQVLESLTEMGVPGGRVVTEHD